MAGERPLLPDALYLTIASILAAAADATIAPGLALQWIQTLESHVGRNGKLSKFSALYVPLQPPAFVWRYSCDNCHAWQEPNGCRWVEGWIAAGGWCSIFMPKEGDPPFTWPAKLLQDAPRWVAEFPEAVRNSFDTQQPPRELWPLGNSGT